MVRTDRYSWSAIWLHWSIAVLVLVNLVIGLFHGTLIDGIAWVIPIRRSIGGAMFALVVLHIAAALPHHFLLRDAVPGRMAPGSVRNG